MATVKSFAPLVGVNPKILILGSMPGVASLEAQQYYAHPRNAFWPIMAELFEVEWEKDYADKVAQFRALPLVLWDVLQSCEREGSLDSAILAEDLRANEIDALLEQHASLDSIVFNGATAETMFRKHVLKDLSDLDRYRFLRLPSTSPAHASQGFDAKLDRWRVILDILDVADPAD
jgi:hypoxanthine-DNA glycosylase